MASLPCMKESVIELIAKNLGDTETGFSGSEIGSLLQECNIEDLEPKSTKWRRLKLALLHKQNYDRCSNNIISFIQIAMEPVRHIEKNEWFNLKIFELNKVLSFEGYQINENGIITTVQKTTTISEANARAKKLRTELVSRKVHNDILLFCKDELLIDNYFHAVFEATKSIAEKIREKTDLTSDGAELIDEAFSFKNKLPLLALNTLVSESEQSEQKGFMNLIKGIFGTFRNTTAHSPKIKWKVEEEDALDILSMISLVHRKLDKAIQVRKIYNS